MKNDYIEIHDRSTQRSSPLPIAIDTNRAFSISRNEEEPKIKLAAGIQSTKRSSKPTSSICCFSVEHAGQSSHTGNIQSTSDNPAKVTEEHQLGHTSRC